MDLGLDVAIPGIGKHPQGRAGRAEELHMAFCGKQGRGVAGRRVDEGPAFRIEKPEEGGDESGQVLFHQKPVGLAKDKMGPTELVSESMNDVFRECGDASRLQSMSGYVANQNRDAATFGLKDIVEVAADLGLAGSRSVEMAELDSGCPLREVDQRLLQGVCDRALLFELFDCGHVASGCENPKHRPLFIFVDGGVV